MKKFVLDSYLLNSIESVLVGYSPNLDALTNAAVKYAYGCDGCSGCNPCTGGV